jgi:hypothetical protein
MGTTDPQNNMLETSALIRRSIRDLERAGIAVPKSLLFGPCGFNPAQRKRHESEHGAHRVDSSAVARRHAKQRQGDHFRLRRIRDVDERLLRRDVETDAADRVQDGSSLPGRRASIFAHSDGCTARQQDALRVSLT